MVYFLQNHSSVWEIKRNKSAKVGDSSGIPFIVVDIEIKKSKIFYFLCFLPIFIIFKNSLIEIICSCIALFDQK